MLVFTNFALFDPDEFAKLESEIHSKLRHQRYGDSLGRRKHPCDALLFSTIGCLTQGMSNIAMEAVVEMSAALINIEFERILKILDEHLEDEWFLMNDAEKELCIGKAKSHPGIMYYIDGCDFALKVGKDAWVYKTHKKNIKKQRAIRAQIIIDSYWGYFRGLEVGPAGLYNDQAMLKKSKWNQPDKLVGDDEFIAADSGYCTTEWINVLTPFSKKELEENPEFKEFNKAINSDRSIIENTFAELKAHFRIFDQPWRRDRHLFPLALRVCLKLLNRYWRLPGNMPPGLRRHCNNIYIR